MPMMREQYDVVIVGGGPAGATCARELAVHRASVLLIDKKNPGWHKPCGGGIPEVMFEPFQVPTTLGFATPKVRVVDAGQRRLNIPMRYRTVYRDRFDEHLAARARDAGAEVLFDTTLLDVERTDTGFFVRTPHGTCQARYLVGADGCMSTVRRKLFPEQLAESMCAIAVEHWYRVPHGITSLDFFVEPAILDTGYVYVFPKDPGLLVIGIAGIAVEKPRAVLERLLELPRYRALTGDAPVAAVHGARIPYRHLSRLRDGRLLLIGDAAGLNTPIIFAGIPIALQSGRLAGGGHRRGARRQLRRTTRTLHTGRLAREEPGLPDLPRLLRPSPEARTATTVRAYRAAVVEATASAPARLRRTPRALPARRRARPRTNGTGASAGPG
jgi:geranylgeranyl reductase family protein